MKQLFKNIWYQFKSFTVGRWRWEIISMEFPAETMQFLFEESLRTEESVNQVIIRILRAQLKTMKLHEDVKKNILCDME